MATGQSIINDACAILEVIAAAGAPSASESDFCLRKLNALIASLSAQALTIEYITREEFTLTGAASYTIGTGGTFSTTRPIKIESGTIRATNGARKKVEWVPVEMWASVVDSTRTGIFADIGYYDNGYPLGTIYLSPAPATGGKFEMYSLKELTQIATLSTTVDIGPGYERMLVTALACEIGSGFGVPIQQIHIDMASDAKTAILGLNKAVIGSPNVIEPIAGAPAAG